MSQSALNNFKESDQISRSRRLLLIIGSLIFVATLLLAISGSLNAAETTHSHPSTGETVHVNLAIEASNTLTTESTIDASQPVSVDPAEGASFEPAPVQVSDVATGPNKLYFAFIVNKIPKPLVTSSKPNSANSWTVSWNDVSAAKYEVQESQTTDFSGASVVDNGSSLTYNVSKTASPNNSYFYRVRGVGPTGNPGDWSDPIEVVGAYFVDFKDDTTNW